MAKRVYTTIQSRHSERIIKALDREVEAVLLTGEKDNLVSWGLIKDTLGFTPKDLKGTK